MQAITVLVAIFVLSFIAGFGWRTGAWASKIMARMLGRGRSGASAKERDAAEASRVKAHEAEEPARGPSGQTPFFR